METVESINLITRNPEIRGGTANPPLNLPPIAMGGDFGYAHSDRPHFRSSFPRTGNPKSGGIPADGAHWNTLLAESG